MVTIIVTKDNKSQATKTTAIKADRMRHIYIQMGYKVITLHGSF